MHKITNKEKQDIVSRFASGETQLSIAKDYRAKGFLTETGKPFMNYTVSAIVSAIVNAKRVKARNKRRQKAIGAGPRTIKARASQATAKTAGQLPSDFIFDTLASRELSNAQKLAVIAAVVSQ